MNISQNSRKIRYCYIPLATGKLVTAMTNPEGTIRADSDHNPLLVAPSIRINDSTLARHAHG